MENTQNFKTTVLNKLKLRFNYSITKENLIIQLQKKI